MKIVGCIITLSVAVVLAGCTAAPHVTAIPYATDVPDAKPQAGLDLSPWAVKSTTAAGSASPRSIGWHHFTFPGKSATQFRYARKDGRDTVAVMAAASASMLRSKVRIEPAELGKVRFSWRVPELIAGADMATRGGDDSPVRIVLAFEGDRSRLQPRDAMLSELVRAVTGEEMPFATLMYVWCNRREPGTVITNARSNRIRQLVVESGDGKLDRWLDYERDIRADYIKAFGEPPGALVAIGIMSDSDNTRTTTTAWYGPVRLASPAAQLQPH